jgi:hypothetical protein
VCGLFCCTHGIAFLKGKIGTPSFRLNLKSNIHVKRLHIWFLLIFQSLKKFTQISISPILTTLGLENYEITFKQKKNPTHIKRLSNSMKSAPEFQERFLNFDSFLLNFWWWDCSIFHNSYIIGLNITKPTLVHPLTHWELFNGTKRVARMIEDETIG